MKRWFFANAKLIIFYLIVFENIANLKDIQSHISRNRKYIFACELCMAKLWRFLYSEGIYSVRSLHFHHAAEVMRCPIPVAGCCKSRDKYIVTGD